MCWLLDMMFGGFGKVTCKARNIALYFDCHLTKDPLGLQPDQCTTCQKELNLTEMKHHCRNCGQISCADCCNNHIVLEDLGYFSPVRVCGSCYESRQSCTGRQLTFSRTSSEVIRPSLLTEDSKNGSELAFELLNALKSANVTDVETNITWSGLFKGET